MSRDAFVAVDIEASGLSQHAFPIEVGWCDSEGQEGEYLIRPVPQWNLDSWDDNAEALHGVSMEELMRDGQDARSVASAINDDFVGKVVLSDAVMFESELVGMLFAAVVV